MQEKFLVTGAAGFIGSHICDALVSKGRNIRTLVRKGADLSHISAHINEGKIEVVCGDLRDPETVKRALDKCTVVINAAALTDLSASLDSLFDTNVRALRMMLELASRTDLRRFVQISSIGAFDKTHALINEDTPLSPINNYDRSKIAGEKIALSYCKEKKAPATILEPSAVYGPRVRIGFKYLLEVLMQGKMRYPVKESTRLNMLYVADLIQAVEKAIVIPEAVGERFIIGDEVSYTYKEIIDLAAKELGVPPPRGHVPFSIAKCYAFYAQTLAKAMGRKPELTVAYFDYLTTDMILDISKAKRILGFKPQYSLAQGMKEMVSWFLTQKETLSPGTGVD
jgi:nucleoside-diphosphate-sugar epimerase